MHSTNRSNEAAWTRLVSNSKWNIAAFFVAMLANFFALPVVIHQIGIAQFGVVGILVGMLAPLMLVGSVIGQACVRDLSAQLAQSRLEAARRTFWSGMWLCVIGCAIVVFVVGAGGAFIAKHFLGGATMSFGALQYMCLISVAGWCAQQFVSVLQAAITAMQSYRALAFLNAGTAIVSACCQMLATILWPRADGLLAGTTAGLVISAIWSFFQARRHAPAFFPVTKPDHESVLRILSFSRWQGVGQFTGSIALQTDRFVLGSISTLSILGQFNVATRLQEVVYMGVLKITEVLFPHFAATANRPVQESVQLLLASSWLTNAIAVAALAPLVPLSSSLICLWAGIDSVPTGGAIMRTLATAGLVGSGTNALLYFMLGQGHSETLARTNIAHCLVVIVASTGLLLVLGPLAAGAGFLFANTLRLLFLIWHIPAMTGCKQGTLAIARTTQTPILAGLIFAWAPWPTALTSVTSWPALAVAYAGFAGTAAIACMLASLAFIEPRSFLINFSAGLLRRFHKVR